MIQAEFGVTAWGRAWVRAVESTAVTRPNPLLPKARSLARNNAVAELAIGVGSIGATVGKYKVHIGRPLWTETPELPATTTGDLPDALAESLTVAVPLDEQVTECGCPARATHCVHVLATLYALAQRIDEYPVLAVDLRCHRDAPTDPEWVSLETVGVAGFYGD